MTEPTLIYFAEEFSTNKAEQFIEQELIFLSCKYKKIVVIPILNNRNECKYQLPSNIEVLDFEIYKPYNRLKVMLENFPLLLTVLFNQIKHSNNKIKYLKDLKRYLSYLLHAINVSQRLELDIVKKFGCNVTYYSFWFNIWVFYLSLTKKSSKFKLVTRAHGGDYDETQTKVFFPFRSFQVNTIDIVAPVSQYGVNYFRERYPFSRATIIKSCIGTKFFGTNLYNESDTFFLVSCSSLIELKRVKLIAEILKYIKDEVTWIHFGDGPLKDELLNEVKRLPENIRFIFKGHVTNGKILEFYKSTPVDLVINVSESEGIPVSLMEAISFGIPVMGTSICGVPEIVCDKTGFIIPKDFDCENVASLITAYRNYPKERKEALRFSAQEYWRRNFNLELNYESFYSKCLSLCAG